MGRTRRVKLLPTFSEHEYCMRDSSPTFIHTSEQSPDQPARRRRQKQQNFFCHSHTKNKNKTTENTQHKAKGGETMTMTANIMTNSSSKNKAGSQGRPRRGSPNDGKPAALSAAAMGRTLVFLATSCAAFQGGHRSVAPSLIRPRGVTAGGRIERVDRGAVSLRYRDGDEDQPVDVRPFAGAVSRARRVVFPTRLPSTSSGTEPQVAMDEYLAFVQRRMDRLHQDASVSRPGAAALSPATIGPPTTLSFNLSFVRKFGPMANFLQGIVAAIISSIKVVSRMILLDNSGLPAACFAILFIAHPVLKGALR